METVETKLEPLRKKIREHAMLSQFLKSDCRRGEGWYELTPIQREALDMIVREIAIIIIVEQTSPSAWFEIMTNCRTVINTLEKKDDK